MFRDYDYSKLIHGAVVCGRLVPLPRGELAVAFSLRMAALDILR